VATVVAVQIRDSHIKSIGANAAVRPLGDDVDNETIRLNVHVRALDQNSNFKAKAPARGR